MMKKLIANGIIIILIIVCGVSIVKGIKITDEFSILSYKDLQEKKASYQKVLEEYEVLTNETYNKKTDSLERVKKEFENNKLVYTEFRKYNSLESLLELTRDKEYQIEFLWIKLGMYARNNDLLSSYVLNDTSNGKKNIKVTLVGDYLSIKNYIYEILIDLDLKFKAENIVIKKMDKDTKVQATFTISNVKILM